MGVSICVHAFIVGTVILNPPTKKQIEPKTNPLIVSVASFVEPVKEAKTSHPKPPISPKKPKIEKPKEPVQKVPQIKEIAPKKIEPKKPIVPELKPPKPQQIIPKKVEKPKQKPQKKAFEDFNLPLIKSNLSTQNRPKEADKNIQQIASNQSQQIIDAKDLPAETKTIEPTWDKVGYLNEIKTAIIRHKSYPARARKMKMQGEVGVVFTILPTGEIVKLAVKKSSGHKYLDSHTLETIKDASRVFPKPLEEISVQIPIDYRLY